MGFISTANTLTLTAKLTPIGRQRLVSTNNGLITSFSLGDSDANYNTPLTLTTGQVPALGGEVGANASVSNSTISNTTIKSKLIVNSAGLLSKPVESQSTLVSIQQTNNGLVTVSGSNLSQVVVDRNNYNNDSLVNLFYSLGLPLSTSDDYVYTGLTYANGGYSDTTLSGLAQTKIIIFGIKNSTYGECLDGKTVKLVLPTSAGTYTIYSTFQNKNVSINTEDANINETSTLTNKIGTNIAFMFSDNILTPNGGSGTLSWATGYNTVKPFSNNGKQFYNFKTDSNASLSADTMVGISYLDKGLIVITHPQIVNQYDSITATGSTVSFDSVSTSVYQNITCIAGRGEFGNSTNTTFEVSDTPRITEIGLYDSLGNLIAIGKTDRQVTKTVNEFKAFNVKITL